MPYQDHPVFHTDRIKQVQLWRYMDLAKFMRMIQTSSLYFSSLETLSSGDRFEGLHTVADTKLLNLPFEQLTAEQRSAYGATDKELWDRLRAILLVRVINDVRDSRRTFAVNCWHAEQHESAAMWKIYAQERYGISIQTTFDRLKRSLADHTADSIFIGEVQYLNYAEDHIPLGNSFYPVICKRREFKYENEVRAVIWRLPLSHDKQSIDMSKDLVGRGIPVHVDLHALIENIYISPYAADYIFDVVSDSVEKYGLSIKVRRSKV